MSGLIDHRYKVIKVLGSGLSGEVLSVEDDQGIKALKTLKRVQMNVSKDEALKSFKNEFSILCELNHPNIARILDFGFDATINKYYFTTELINGSDFFAATANSTAEEIENLAVQVLRALNYLHSRGIFHFDIKPQNILVKEENGKKIAKIIDFGLAGFTSPRKKVGTPAYMAPEVILGGNLDGRTDLYSFGVLLYKSLTRENPFACKEIGETLNRQRTLIPQAASSLKNDLPPFWDRVLARLLEKNPNDRYPQAQSVIRDINFLHHKNYDIETIDTRLSYLPEKGNLIGRQKEMEIFKNLFEVVFKSGSWSSVQLLIIEGASGTGKSRFINECKYYSQLQDIAVYYTKNIRENATTQTPFCLVFDEDTPVSPPEINDYLQKYANSKVLIIWATDKAPVGWSHCEKISLHNFTKDDLKNYLIMVTGLENPPEKLVDEIYSRTEGNPLFVCELLKTMLENNWLLDSSGRWASSTFDAIEIKFDSIQVPKTLEGLLLKKFSILPPESQEILKWLAIINRPVSLDTLRQLTHTEHPQTTILSLTRENIIQRTDREQHYFFSNILLRDSLYAHIDNAEAQRRHEHYAALIESTEERRDEFLFHVGHAGDDKKAVDALSLLAEKALSAEKYPNAVKLMNSAWSRAKHLSEDIKIVIEEKLAHILSLSRDYKQAISHYENLKNYYDIKNEAPEQRVLIYEKLGDLYVKQDQYGQGLELFQKALNIITGTKDESVSKMLIENHIANIFVKTGKTDDAIEIYQRNQKKWESEFNESQQDKVLNNHLAIVLQIKQKYPEALEIIDKNIKFFERINNQYQKARALYIKSDIHYKIMLQSQAEKKAEHKSALLKLAEECILIAREIDASDLLMRAYNSLGNLHYHEKETAPATEYYQKALALARKAEDFMTAATLAANLGNIYSAEKKPKDAYSYFIYAIYTLEGIELKTTFSWQLLFTCYAEIAEVHLEMNELDKAEEALTKANDILTQNDHLSHFEFWIWMQRTKLYHRLKHRSLFRDSLRKAELLAKEGLEKESLEKFKSDLVANAELDVEEVELTPEKIAPPFQSNGTEDNINKIQQQWENIIKINRLLNSEPNLDYLLKMVINFALELADAESGLVILLNENGELEVKAAVNEILTDELTRFSNSVAQECLQKGEVIVSADAHTDNRFDGTQSVVLNDLKSILCLPLKSKNKLIGVLYMDNRYKTDAFKSVNHRILHAYADQVGIALENTRLIARYEEAKKQLESKLHQTEDELEEVKEILKNESSISMNRYSYEHIIGKSKPMKEVFKILDKITETNLAIYLQGASGTGKELIARAIHFNNPNRCNKRFVAINCGAIPANLMESELFGYKAGSFTGAQKDKKGLFEEADGGSLFLDEVADLDHSLQVKLLRVLQEGEVQRIGDTKPIKVDVRIISASHKSVDDLVAEKKFREDLYYRLCQMKISLPSLAERKEDIPLLVEHFVSEYTNENSVSDKIRVESGLMKAFFSYQWPGNIRELENTIQVACALRDGPVINLKSLPANHGVVRFAATDVTSSTQQKIEPEPQLSTTIQIDEANFFTPAKTWQDYEKVIIAKAYEANRLHKNKTSQALDISPATLYTKIKTFDLENLENPVYKDKFVYSGKLRLKDYIPLIFKAALAYSDNHPYTAIKQLGVSQGYFYKIIKT